MFANPAEPADVAVLSMLWSWCGLKVVAGVAELSKCCERAGFFKVLQYEILDFFLTCLLR